MGKMAVRKRTTKESITGYRKALAKNGTLQKVQYTPTKNSNHGLRGK
jgi:hypothetical protein